VNPFELNNRLRKVSTPWPDAKPLENPSKISWFSRKHANIFHEIMRRKRLGVYVELGSWTGTGSTAFVLKNYPFLSVVCVDTFKGSEEHTRNDTYAAVAANLWDHFCSNVWESRDRVYPLRCGSREGLRYLFNAEVAPSYIYIDAAHDEDSVFLDIQAAVQLFPQAILLGDDYVSPEKGHPGVFNGVARAINAGIIAKDKFRNYDRIWYVLP
jgi:hypothetical protein